MCLRDRLDFIYGFTERSALFNIVFHPAILCLTALLTHHVGARKLEGEAAS